MTALRIIGWWLLASFVLGALWAAYRAAAGDIEAPAELDPCPGCADRDRQLAAAKEHVRLLERANAGLADKVTRLEARRRSERAS